MSDAVFPIPLPLDGWAALGNGMTEIINATNYARMPVHLTLETDGSEAANSITVEWPTAQSDWGAVSSVLVYTAPTGGDVVVFAPLVGSGIPYSFGDYSAGPYSPPVQAALVVNRYDRVRIQAGALQVQPEEFLPIGYGRLGFGRYGFGNPPPQLTGEFVPVGFGLGGFGTGAYAAAQIADGTVSVLKTFARFSPCQAGTWSPGPWARAA